MTYPDPDDPARPGDRRASDPSCSPAAASGRRSPARAPADEPPAATRRATLRPFVLTAGRADGADPEIAMETQVVTTAAAAASGCSPETARHRRAVRRPAVGGGDLRPAAPAPGRHPHPGRRPARRRPPGRPRARQRRLPRPRHDPASDPWTPRHRLDRIVGTARVRQRPGRKPPLPVKIVIAGGFGVGKTTTVGAISEIAPLTTEAEMTAASARHRRPRPGRAKTTTTVAMDFGCVTIDQTLKLYLFGTPGQTAFGFMWDDLAKGALGALVIVDSQPAGRLLPGGGLLRAGRAAVRGRRERRSTAS